MKANPFDIARERIRHHQAEIARLTAFLEMAEALLKDAPEYPAPQPNPIGGALAPAAEPKASPLGMPNPTMPVVYPSSSSPTPTKEVLLQAEELFRQMNKAMPASEVYEWLVRRGIRIAGKNPKGNLTAKFATQKERFAYDKDTGLWSLSEWTKAKTNEAPTDQSESASKPENGGTANTDMFS
ncbi:hypothetical protein HJA96_21945 [Rhizobium binae]|nr:hypothetical protein [Rhizobium binae]